MTKRRLTLKIFLGPILYMIKRRGWSTFKWREYVSSMKFYIVLNTFMKLSSKNSMYKNTSKIQVIYIFLWYSYQQYHKLFFIVYICPEIDNPIVFFSSFVAPYNTFLFLFAIVWACLGLEWQTLDRPLSHIVSLG